MDIRPTRKLVGVSEIAELFGVTRQAVTNWRTRKASFPKPIAELRSGPVWEQSQIVGWAKAEKMNCPPAG